MEMDKERRGSLSEIEGTVEFSKGVGPLQVAEGIRKNPLLSKGLHYVKMGWPQKVEPALSLYFARRNKLTIEEDCLLRGIQVIVPPNLHKRMLELFHESHLGVVKMNALARSHVWWPEIDKALEEVTKHCEECQTNHKEDLKTPLLPFEFTSKT